MTMSPFIIFAIVLTIAYVLYYATIITMDLNAKSKKEGELEENISAVDGKEIDEEYVPQTVVENVETGGFSFMEAPEDEEESVPEEQRFDEEEEHNDILSNTLDEQKQEFESEQEIQESASEEPEANNSLETAEEKPSIDETPEENTIPTVDFSEALEPVVGSEEPFDEGKVFDADLAQPQYAVSTIIGDKADRVLAQRIENIGQKLQSCQAEGKLINPFEFVNEAKGDREKSNIDFKDEFTQF